MRSKSLRDTIYQILNHTNLMHSLLHSIFIMPPHHSRSTQNGRDHLQNETTSGGSTILHGILLLSASFNQPHKAQEKLLLFHE